MDLDLLQKLWDKHWHIPAAWPVALLTGAAVLLLGWLAYRLIFGILRRFAAQTETYLDDLLVRRMRTPARFLVFLLALHSLLYMRGSEHPGLRKTVLIVEMLLGSILVIEALETIVIHYWLEERRKIQVPAVLRHLLLIVLYAVAVLSILGSVAGVHVMPLLATSTVLTVVLGLALQDSLGNLFAGLALSMEKPFAQGDWLMVDGLECQVLSLGWRATHLRTFSGDLIVLPNAQVAKARLQNFYAPAKLTGRTLEVLVSLSASPEAVQRAVDRGCDRTVGVRADPAPRAWLVAFTPLFQRYSLRFWIDDFQQHDDIESNLMKALWHELREEGVQLAEAHATMAAADQANPTGPAVARRVV